MHYVTLEEARQDAVKFTQTYKYGCRVIAFDYKPFFEGEEEMMKYALVNLECTTDEMRGAGYVNPRVVSVVYPAEKGR